MNTHNSGVLVVERVFDALPDFLFDAWTRPELLVQWWGPEGATTPEYDLDVREGGRWSTVMQTASGEQFRIAGVYRVIDKPRRLVFTWNYRHPDGTPAPETLIEVTFEQAVGGTQIRLKQQAFATLEDFNNHQAGWTSSFNDLARFVAKNAARKEG
jgi:uncharacterized protein YndB with AHSA1/START domain